MTSPILRLGLFGFFDSSMSALESGVGLLNGGHPSFFQAFQCSSRFNIFLTVSANVGPSGGVSVSKAYTCSVVPFTHSTWSGFSSCVSLKKYKIY